MINFVILHFLILTYFPYEHNKLEIDSTTILKADVHLVPISKNRYSREKYV